MKFSDFVRSDAIITELQSTDRDSVIRELVNSLIDVEAIDASLREPLVEILIERENQGSTGFGKGVSVPHIRHEKVPAMVGTIGISQPGIDFNALDKAPVHSVVLLLSPEEQRDEHLQAMENIFRSLQNETFRRFLRQVKSREDVMELIQEADARQLQG